MNKNEVPQINWKILLGDIGFEAATMAFNDPECKKELEPIREQKKKLIEELKDEEDRILKKYKQKYMDQLCKEKEVQQMLIQAYLQKRCMQDE